MRLLVVLVAVFVLVGCTQDDTDMGTQGATPPPASLNWLDALLNAASEGTVSTQPTAVLSQGEIDQLLRTLVVPSSAAASIATELNSIDASWSLGEADLVQFADEICVGRPSVSDLYTATCAGTSVAVTDWAKERLNAGQGAASCFRSCSRLG
jgi:hypothetical protein